MRRTVLLLALALILATGVIFAIPAARFRLLALLTHEPLYNGRPVSYWLTALEAGDADERREAALTLAEPELVKTCSADQDICRRVIGGLVATLSDSDVFVRKCAATSLLSYPRETPIPGGAAVVDKLLAALDDAEVTVRKAAARSLWQLGEAAGQGDGVARLTGALLDKDDFVREYAARTLGRIGPDAKTAAPALLDRLAQDEERDVREHAAKSLGLIGPKALGPLLEKTIAALTKGLQDPAADVRENSARSLGQLGARGSVDALKRIRADPEVRVRTAVNYALRVLTASSSPEQP